MSYRPGEIYFVRENVLGSDKLSSFVKIGLVADKRTSDERLKEHQTGNPRRLQNQAVVSTGAVHRVEAMMHRIYAPFRVSGEWFDFQDEAKVLEAIDQVKTLAADVETWTPTFDQAEALATQESDGPAIAPNDQITEIANRWAIANTKVLLCADLEQQIRGKFVQALAAGVDVKGAVTEKEVFPKPKFNTTLFKKELPEKYEEYQKVSTTWSGTFKVLLKALERSALDADFLAQFAELEAQVAAVVDPEHAYLLNETELALTNLGAIAEWELDIATAQIKIECGTAAGIEGICTWERKWSSRTGLDVDKLANLEPDLFIQYFLPRESYKRIKVTKAKS